MTCICLSRNRREWLPQAIRCYQTQTYKRRELLILADGDSVLDLVPPNDPSIALVHLAHTLPIGEKRNFAARYATGDVLAHFDDDDWSAPGRLEDQVGRLASTGRAVTGYRTMRFTDGLDWWLYCGAADFVLGTSLVYQRDWWEQHPFPARQIGEDNHFVSQAAARGMLASVEAGDLMWATIHAGNSSPRTLRGKQWQKL